MKTLTFGQALAGFILPLIAVISLVLTGNNIVIALFAAVLVESFLLPVSRVLSGPRLKMP